jgi:hypothetical protein
MIVNFKAREISRGACKLAQTLTLTKKKKKNNNNNNNNNIVTLKHTFHYLVL